MHNAKYSYNLFIIIYLGFDKAGITDEKEQDILNERIKHLYIVYGYYYIEFGNYQEKQN